MKDPEEAIERVLSGLRDAAAPAGMEARILRAIRSRDAAKPSRGWWRVSRTGPLAGRGQGWPLAGAAMAAAVVVVLAVVGLTTRKSGQVARGTRDVRVTATSSSLPAAAEAVPSEQIHACCAQTNDKQQHVQTQIASGNDKQNGYSGRSSAPGKTAGSRSETNGPVDYDSLAVSEMLASTRPAPPLPLTQQETLMMRVLRHGAREEQLAMLDPAVRARDEAQSETDFHNFFDPPVPDPNE
jgi:hypothetical protein